MNTRTDPPSKPRPHITPLVPLVPLLTIDQLELLTGISRGPVSLLDCEFSDAIALKVADLIEVDRATDKLVMTDAGRKFLAASP